VEIPVFDITGYYNGSDIEDLLVRNMRLGAALARQFSDENSRQRLPDHYAVLMQSHGFATAAEDLKTAVFQAIYTQNDATVQADALEINAAYKETENHSVDGLVYLTDRQARDSWKTDRVTVDKPWDLWAREVQVSPLYVNRLQ
jgi:hypothetical protein